MIALTHINDQNFQESDVEWLIQIASSGYNDATPEKIAQDAMQGVCQLWRIEGDAKGVLQTKIRLTKNGHALWIEGIAGENLLQSKHDLWESIKDLGRELKCSMLLGLIWDKVIATEVLKLGGKNVGIAFSVEI